MDRLVTSEFILGIIAGGRQARALALAAQAWNIRTQVLDAESTAPAASCCTLFVQGDPLSFEDVYRFGRSVDMLTFDTDRVNTAALMQLRRKGKRIHPDPELVGLMQDKGLQRELFVRHAIPTAPFREYDNAQQLFRDVQEHALDLPFIQKIRRRASDGPASAIIRSTVDLRNVLEGACIVEPLLDIGRELLVIVARNGREEARCYPVMELRRDPSGHRIERALCPASIPVDLEQRSRDIATALATAIELRGLLAVEMLVDRNGAVLVNNASPYPPLCGPLASACAVTSQSEQQLRAIFNLPLGSTRITNPAVLLTIFGGRGSEGRVRFAGLNDALAIEGVKIELYNGMDAISPFRLIGHATVLAPTIEEAMLKADIVSETLKVTPW
jgi:5-(carboxyamino)imidazole ribonucleotide synthase